MILLLARLVPSRTNEHLLLHRVIQELPHPFLQVIHAGFSDLAFSLALKRAGRCLNPKYYVRHGFQLYLQMYLRQFRIHFRLDHVDFIDIADFDRIYGWIRTWNALNLVFVESQVVLCQLHPSYAWLYWPVVRLGSVQEGPAAGSYFVYLVHVVSYELTFDVHLLIFMQFWIKIVQFGFLLLFGCFRFFYFFGLNSKIKFVYIYIFRSCLFNISNWNEIVEEIIGMRVLGLSCLGVSTQVWDLHIKLIVLHWAVLQPFNYRFTELVWLVFLLVSICFYLFLALILIFCY